MSNKNKIKLNMKFINGEVVCARSPSKCGNCKEECEKMELLYNPFKYSDIKECFRNNEKRR